MALFIASLNSGSNGNCYYIGNETEAVLVDAGISCREIEKRMKGLDLPMARVKAVFISHEHADHIKGIAVLSKKYQLPVYITPPTLQYGYLRIEKQLIHAFTAVEPIAIGSLIVQAFSKHHDASDPYSFTVSCDGISVGVFTDIGTPCDQLVHHFKTCHAAFLEANYDEEMLDKGSYPFVLKHRIRNGKGHLSNRQALELFVSHRPAFMSHLILSHLSKNNNCPKLVHDLFNTHAKGVQVIVASRDEASPIFCIGNDHVARSYTVQQLDFAFV